jgi:hypothetical protein
MKINSIIDWDLFHEMRGTPIEIKTGKLKTELKDYLPPVTEIIEFYRKIYVGKEFVSKDEHGSETFGVIKNIDLTVNVTRDKHTQKEIEDGHLNFYLDDFEYKKKYSAYQVLVSVISKDDVSYNLNEIFVMV